MGWRFRKRLRLLPGVYWNIGSRGSSLGVKIGGLTKTFSRRGVRTSVNLLRGSGISYSEFTPARDLPPRRHVFVKLVLSVFAGFVVFSYFLSAGSREPVPAQQSQTGPASASSPVPSVAQSSVDAAPSPEPAKVSYQGTAVTDFGKTWVMVDGKKLDGIMAANPAPGGQVAILYNGGGRDVPAGELPQGFLDAWNLTPQILRAQDGQ